MSYQYKGVTIDSNFCTTGTLDVAQSFDGFPLAPTTYLNTTADTINTDFGYGESFPIQGYIPSLSTGLKNIVITNGTTPTLYKHTISGAGITTQQLTTVTTNATLATYSSTVSNTIIYIDNQLIDVGDFVYGNNTVNGLQLGAYVTSVTNKAGNRCELTMSVPATITKATDVSLTFWRLMGTSNFAATQVGTQIAPITMTAALSDLKKAFNAYTDEFEATLSVVSPNYSFTTNNYITQPYCSPVTGTRYPSSGSIPSYFNTMKILLYGSGGGGGGGRAGNNAGFGGGGGGFLIADISLNSLAGNRINYFNYNIGGGGKGGSIFDGNQDNNVWDGQGGGSTTLTVYDTSDNNVSNKSIQYIAYGGAGGNYGKGGTNNGQVGGLGGSFLVTSNNTAPNSISTNIRNSYSGVAGERGFGNQTTTDESGGRGGSSQPSVAVSNSNVFGLSQSQQTTPGANAVKNNYCGSPGTDVNYNFGPNYNLISLSNFVTQGDTNNGTATYYFYNKNVAITANTINNTARIGYGGGGGGGGVGNSGRNTTGGPGAPGFIKIWLYA